MRHIRGHALLGFALLLVACGAPADREERGTATAHPFAARREAQRQLDSAVAAFRLGALDTAAGQLRVAARFFREHPDLSSSTARGAFGAVALDLDRLADEIAARRMRDTTILATTIARAQLAEAEHHRGRAAAAWMEHRAEIAGEELALAVDHLERAMCDARLTRSPAVLPIVQRSRAAALSLLRGSPDADVQPRLDALAREIRRLDASTRTGSG